MASIFTRASAAIDRGVVRFMERRMAPRAPKIDVGDARTRLVELARAYSDGTLGVPSAFFPTPPLPRVTVAPLGEGPPGIAVYDLAYPSTYEPFLAAARELHDRVPENHTAHVRWWTTANSEHANRPTIVLLHGWGGGNHWVTARTFLVPYWLRHGYDVAAFVLPFHGDRAPAAALPLGPRSGAGVASWPSPNPMRTNEGFGQAIHDLRALALWLRARGATAVGALGMSLGGYTTSLWASIAGHGDAGGLDFAVAMIPAVSMSKLFWRHGETSPVRRRAASAGITEDLLADAFAVHAPLTRPVRLSRDRLAVIAGRGDRITPPDQAEALAAHWGVPIAWFEGGHLAQVGRGDALRAVRRQLGALELPGRSYRGGER